MKDKNIDITRFGDVLKRARRDITNQQIMRFKYDISVEEGLAVVTEIGKMRKQEFVIDNENRFAYENIIKWVNGDMTAQALNPDTRAIVPAKMKSGWFIAGNTGTGKSWCMETIRNYITAIPMEIEINRERRDMAYQIVRADDITDEFMRAGSLKKYRDIDILCIQDVGAEARETLYMGNRVEVIRALLEWRGDNASKLTFITSNYPPTHPKFAERYGDRVVSRMRELNYYEIKGKDRRK